MAKTLFPHESEIVEFHLAESQSCAFLWPILFQAGLTFRQEVWSMPRCEPVPNAQSESTVSASIFLDDKEIYLYEEEVFDSQENLQWNRIELKYLLATLPEGEIGKFTVCAAKISAGLQLPILYNGQIVDATELQFKFHQFYGFLETEYGGAGSQTIRHFIDIHYSWPNS